MKVFVLFYNIHLSWAKDDDIMVGVFSSSEETLNSIAKLKTSLLEDHPDLSYLKFYVVSCEVDGVGREKVYSEYYESYPDGDTESGSFGKVEHPNY